MKDRREYCVEVYGKEHPVSSKKTFRSHQMLMMLAGGSKNGGVRRPGKTASDHGNGSWASKHERNARQAAYRENDAKKKK